MLILSDSDCLWINLYKELADEVGVGEITLRDIVKELEKPARDPLCSDLPALSVPCPIFMEAGCAAF